MRIVTQLPKPLLILDAHNGARRVANNRIGVGLQAVNNADLRGVRDNHQVGFVFSAAERTRYALPASYFDDAGRRAGHCRSPSQSAKVWSPLAVDSACPYRGIVNPVIVMVVHVIANEPPQMSFV